MTNQQFNDQYRPEAPPSVQQTNNELIQNVLDLAINRIRNSNSEYRNAVLTSAHIRVTNRALNDPSPFLPLLAFQRAQLLSLPDFRDLMEDLHDERLQQRGRTFEELLAFLMENDPK
jgi:hypothetical protein